MIEIIFFLKKKSGDNNYKMGCCSNRDNNSFELNNELISLPLYEIETISKNPNNEIMANNHSEELQDNDLQMPEDIRLNLIIIPLRLINQIRIAQEEEKKRDEDEISDSFNFGNVGENDVGENEDSEIEEEEEESEDEGLTPTTINSLKLVIYNNKITNKMESNYENDCRNCSICIKDYENGEKIRYLPCKHSFHQMCVDYWLSLKNSCPLCKGKI